MNQHHEVVTIKQIALACHVSTATVSRALNEKLGVSAEVRSVILEYARNHHYVPDSNARSLRMEQPDTVFIVVRSDLENSPVIPVQGLEILHMALGLHIEILSTIMAMTSSPV